MPNIWTRTNRKIYEAFKGPRTVDTDFNKKVEEIRREEKDLAHLLSIIERFHQSRETHKVHLMETNHFFMNCYDPSSHYWPYMNDIIITHKELEKLHDNYIENIMRITNLSNDLNIKLNSIRENIKERDRLRFIHDHYDEKMEKYVRERNSRLESGKSESFEFVQGFERNDKKYREAAKNYIDQSIRTYKMMDDYIYLKPNYLNPIICQLIQEEIRFYNESSNLMLRLNGASERFQAADLSRSRIDDFQYDPAKYIRGLKILLAKSVISDQLVPVESNGVRIVQDIPTHNTQEVVIQSIVSSSIPDKNIEREEQVKTSQPISNVVQRKEIVSEPLIKQIDTENNGVINVQNLYLSSPNQNYILHDSREIFKNQENQIIQEDEESEYYESELSDVKNENNYNEQNLPVSNESHIHQERYKYPFTNQIKYNPNMNYINNSFFNQQEDVPLTKEIEISGTQHNYVEIPKTESIETNLPQNQLIEANQTKISENDPILNQNMVIAQTDRIEVISNYRIPKMKNYVLKDRNQIPRVENNPSDNIIQDSQPTNTTNQDTSAYKKIESDDKVKLVFNIAPLLKTYIRANSRQQEIKKKNRELYEYESEGQIPSNKMTGVSDEFVYSDPNTNELLKVRVSLKNKNNET